MNRLFFLIITFALLTLQCQQEQLPEGILTEEKMTALLIDLSLLEGAINIEQTKARAYDTFAIKKYESLLQKHQLTKQLFEANLHYYALQPDVLSAMYGNAIDSLTKQQSVLQTQKINE